MSNNFEPPSPFDLQTRFAKPSKVFGSIPQIVSEIETEFEEAVRNTTSANEKPSSSPPTQIETDGMRAKAIMKLVGKCDTLHEALSPNELLELRKSTFDPNSMMDQYVYGRPTTCIFGGSLIFLIVGIMIGSMLLKSSPPSAIPYRSVSECNQRTVNQVMSYV